MLNDLSKDNRRICGLRSLMAANIPLNAIWRVLYPCGCGKPQLTLIYTR
jgi:hypothetical protein